MPQIYNAGSDIIEAYLKGTQVKQHREQLAAQAQAQQIAAEQRQQKIDNAVDEFNRRLDQDKNVAAAKLEVEKAKLKHDALRLGFQGVQTLKTGKDAEGNPVDVGRILLGDTNYFHGIKLPTQEEISQAKANEAGLVTTAQQTAAAPFKREETLTKADVASQAQERNFNFLRSEHKLNRDAQQANILAQIQGRLQATSLKQTGSAAEKAEEKKALHNEAIEAYKPDVFDGTTTLEELPKGDIGVKINTNVRGEGIKIINNKERDKLLALKSLEGFNGKVKQLNALYQSGKGPLDLEVRALQESIDADLTIFGREAKAEKGVVTDKDIVRLQGAIPKYLPGGMAGIFDKKGRSKANQARTDEIERLYFEKAESLLKGMSPAQRKAVENRFNVMSRIEKVEE